MPVLSHVANEQQAAASVKRIAEAALALYGGMREMVLAAATLRVRLAHADLVHGLLGMQECA